MTMTEETPRNYAPLWKKLTVAGAIVLTVASLVFSQNLTKVSASDPPSTFLSPNSLLVAPMQPSSPPMGKLTPVDGTTRGQLGVQAGSKVNVADWTEINVPEKLVTVKTSDHTVAISESGKLYTWGANNNGQIGNGGTDHCFHTNPNHCC